MLHSYYVLNSDCYYVNTIGSFCQIKIAVSEALKFVEFYYIRIFLRDICFGCVLLSDFVMYEVCSR
jgi:hypothetical protein